MEREILHEVLTVKKRVNEMHSKLNRMERRMSQLDTLINVLNMMIENFRTLLHEKYIYDSIVTREVSDYEIK